VWVEWLRRVESKVNERERGMTQAQNKQGKSTALVPTRVVEEHVNCRGIEDRRLAHCCTSRSSLTASFSCSRPPLRRPSNRSPSLRCPGSCSARRQSPHGPPQQIRDTSALSIPFPFSSSSPQHPRLLVGIHHHQQLCYSSLDIPIITSYHINQHAVLNEAHCTRGHAAAIGLC